MSLIATSYGVYTNNLYDLSINRITNANISNAFIGPIACSSDGKSVFVGIYNRNATNGYPNNPEIHISNTYGNRFTGKILNGNSWFITATMSKDGKCIFGGLSNNIGGAMYISNNYGNSWSTPSDITSSDRITSIACSSTGNYAVALHTNNNVYRSHDFGNSWITVTNIPRMNTISMSSSGKYVALTSSSQNKIYLSSDKGNTWRENTEYTTYILTPSTDCSGETSGIKITGNGRILIVCVSAVYSSGVLQRKGGIFISKDFGNNWEKTSAPTDRRWKRVVSSENGQYITATSVGNNTVSNNQIAPPFLIYYSKNFGNDWRQLANDSISGVYDIWWSEHITTTSSGQYVLIAGSAGIGNYVANNYTYSYTPIKIAYNNTFNFTFTCTLYDCSGKYFLRNEKNETLSTKVITDTTVNSITFTDISTNSFDYGMSNLFVFKQNDNIEDDPGFDIQISDPMVINATCFLEGTKILAMDKKRIMKYIPIEKLKPGMLVKTLHAGFVPIKYIGYSTIYNPGLATRVRDQLFIYKKSAYPELTEDLVLTGNHSILVDTITDEEREQIIETLGNLYVTEQRYRLPAFNDKRAVPYEQRGDFRIWNLALENEDYYANYGIYANGLLVETTSCRYIKEISRMTLIE